MGRNFKQIVQETGSVKKSTIERRGQTKKKLSEGALNFKESKLISRTVMRHPDSETLSKLQEIHQTMKDEFASMPDSSLTWLLGGSSEMSRGGFQDGRTKTAAQKFKEFLNTDPAKIPPQKLITSLETIGTAMGYRAIKASWVEPPFAAETPDQIQMAKKIESIMGKKLTIPIGNVYTARAADEILSVSHGTHVVMGEQEDVSSASEDEKESQLPRKTLGARAFRKNVHGDRRSWMGSADEGNIHIRNHTSGTCPLTLAAIDGLGALKTSTSDWMGKDSNFEKLSGVLVVPTFLRGDYHSLAETAAGVKHYLTERRIKSGDKIANTPMQPHEAFEMAVSMLVSASSDIREQQDDACTIRDAVKKTGEAILKRTKIIPAYAKAFNPKKPANFYKTTSALKRKLQAAKKDGEAKEPDKASEIKPL